ncbi:MAG: ABC transporter ATP-binding protein [Planctomycetaceae bacterium]
MTHTIPFPMHTRQTHISAVAISKSYAKAELSVPVLRGVDVSVGRGELLSVVGQSGSGKSTLLQILGLLDAPNSGEVRLQGKRIDDLPESTRDELRNRIFGFVFQSYHLLPELSLLENVLSPLMIRHSAWDYWQRRRELRDRAREIISTVGLSHRETHKPRELSGGEMQRTAIARALVGQPEILLADEPTGNLDSQTSREIMTLLQKLNEDRKLTVLLVTHDESVARAGHRIVRLTEGRCQVLGEAA